MSLTLAGLAASLAAAIFLLMTARVLVEKSAPVKVPTRAIIKKIFCIV